MVKPYVTEEDPTRGLHGELLSAPWLGSKNVDEIILTDRVWHAKYLDSRSRRPKNKPVHPMARFWTNPAWGARNHS